MNFKKAIEWLDSIRPGKVQTYDSVSQYNFEYEMNINRTQQLLRTGEINSKYKKMWEDFKERNAGVESYYVNQELGSIRNIMINFEQKYFPKVYKRKWVIELETTDVHAIRNADRQIQDRFYRGDKYFGCDLKIKEDRG